MQRILIFLAGLFLVVPAFAAPGSGIVILSAADAPGKVSLERIAACERLIAQDLKINEVDIPRIVVMHVSQRAGAAAGVPRTTVRRNYDAANDQTVYYEFWIVGEPRDIDYSAGVMNILENRSGQKVEEKERMAILQRAVRFLQSTVSAYGE